MKNKTAMKNATQALKLRYANYKDTRETTRQAVPKDLRDDILTIRLKFGLSGTIMAEKIEMSSQVLNRWIRENRPKNSVVASKYGDGARYDLPTKALMVQRMVENGEVGIKLAEELDVHQGTLSAWKKQYADNYTELLDLPDGTMILAKPEKLIFGLENVQDYINYKQKQTQNSKAAIELMQECAFPQELMDKAIQFEEEIENEITILQQAEKIMDN